MKYSEVKFTRASFLPFEVSDLKGVEPYYKKCKIFYFREVQENPLPVRNMLKLLGLYPVMKNFDGKNYLYYEDFSHNLSVEANRLYIAISWRWVCPEVIMQDLEMTGNLMKSPPERNIELLRRGSGLFWPGEGLTEEADTWPE